MKKYVSFILSIILLLSAMAIYAADTKEETADNASMSVEIMSEVENSSVENDISNEDSLLNKSENTDQEDTDAPAETNADNFVTNDNSELNIEKYEEAEEIEESAEIYNSAESWRTTAAMTSRRADCELVSINGELYAVGGMDETGYLNTIEKYRSDNRWHEVTDIPYSSKGFAVAADDSKIYIIGGYDGSQFLKTVQVYDTVSDSWSNLKAMNAKRDQSAALYMNNKLYVFGGRDVNGFVNNYEYYDFIDEEWKTVTYGFDEGIIRIGARVQYIDGYICIYGGIDKEYSYAGVDMYSVHNMREGQNIIPAGYEHISIAWGKDKALLFAWDRDTDAFDVQEMTVESDNIATVNLDFTNTPYACKYTEYTIHNGYLHAVGGYVASSKSYRSNSNIYSVYYGDYSASDGTIDNVVTEGGNSITLNVEADREYTLIINVKNMSSFDGYVFSIEYPEGSFSITDGCAMTPYEDISTGNVPGTDIVITENAAYGMSFKCTEILDGIKQVTKPVNAIRIKANETGQKTIKYSMVQE